MELQMPMITIKACCRFCYYIHHFQLQAAYPTTTVHYSQYNTYSAYLRCVILTLLTMLYSPYNTTLTGRHVVYATLKMFFVTPPLSIIVTVIGFSPLQGPCPPMQHRNFEQALTLSPTH